MSDELSPEVFDAVCRQADQAARAQERLAQANTEAKNELLLAIADALDEHAADIEAANALDMLESKENGMDAGKLDRLLFDVPRVAAAAQGVRHVATLPDPVGEIVRGYNLPNGLRLTQTRVPMGVIGMIYEARPNVTVDVSSLCLKSGNAALLRGGHAAERTNAATLGVIAPVLEAHGFESALVQSVDQYGRAGATAMMEARGHIDVLVPRGGAGLIQAVVRNSTVPVIETGAGNVHIYIDKSGDLAKAIPIIINAKTQRVGVCNAAEKLLVHKDVAAEFLPQIAAALAEANVVLQADTTSYDIISGAAIEGLDLNHALKRIGTLNTWPSKWASRWCRTWTRPSTTSTRIPQATPNPSSPRIMRPSRNSPSASTRPWSWSAPPPASPTAACLALVLSLASLRRRCTHAVPWDCGR